MENRQKERRHLSHHALVESAIRLTKQLASSNDIMTRSLANRMFSDLTLLRRGLPNRRQHESTHGQASEIGAIEPPAEEIIKTATDVQTMTESATPEVLAEANMPIAPAETLLAPALLKSSARHILQTRERIKAYPFVICLNKETFPVEVSGFLGPVAAHQLHVITPDGKPLGLLDLGEAADSNSLPYWQRAFDLTTTCTARPARAMYCGDLMAQPGAFSRYCQAKGSNTEWMLQITDGHPLARNDIFWAAINTGAALGEAEFNAHGHDETGKIHMRLWSKRVEIPSEDEERCWATCVLAQPIGSVSEESPLRLLTNRNIPDLGHAAEIISWQRAVLAFEEFVATDRDAFHNSAGSVAHRLENWRMAQLAWHLEQQMEVEATMIFSAEEIRAAHLLARRSMPNQALTLADMLTLLIELGSRPGAQTKLHAGLQRLADAVTGLGLS